MSSSSPSTPTDSPATEPLRRQASELADYVRATPRAAGVEAILLPGDPERRTLQSREAQGIPLERNHWTMLVELAQRLGVHPPAVHSID